MASSAIETAKETKFGAR